MDEDFTLIIVLLAGVILGIVCGLLLARSAIFSLKDECQQNHSGYECRVGAYPLGKDKNDD